MRARIVPQKKATRPKLLGCTCDQDLFVLVLVFTPECEGKISVPKEVLVPPSENVSPQKKATGPTPFGCICDKDLFVLFLISTPKYEGKIRTKGGFCAPKRECVPKQKSCPKRKQQDRCHWGAISKKTFVLFFGLSPKCEGKICVKGGFCAPKAKIVPEKKATGPTPRTCICDKYLFFGLHPRIYFFAPPKFSMPLSSPAHYSGSGSASMNRNKAEDCFFGRSQYHIYFNRLFRLG